MKVRLAVLAGAVLAVSACGGSKSGSPAPAANAKSTVTAQKISGSGTVLVDAKGDALYSPAQEKGGKILCTGGCTAVWVPLTVVSGTTPTAGQGVSGKLGVVKRPDGSRQVSWNGSPLYTFANDSGPGHVTGNGATDSFSGMSFTWHVATADGASPPEPAPPTTSGGGYGY